MNNEKKAQYFDGIFGMRSSVNEGLFSFWMDFEDDEVYVSEETAEYFGFHRINKNTRVVEATAEFEEHIYPDDLAYYKKALEQFLEDGEEYFDVLYRLRNKNGEYETCSTKADMIYDEKGRPLFIAGHIFNHERNDAVDPTTGLFTRSSLFAKLQLYQSMNRPFFLMVIGIRNFFYVNNMYGVKVGNHVLKYIADYCKSICGNENTFRNAGTKIVMLWDMKKHSQKSISDFYFRLREHLKSGIEIEYNKVTLEINGGMVVVDDPTIDVNTIFMSALYALAKAKEEFIPELNVFKNESFTTNQRLLGLLNEVRIGAEKGCDGFYLCYQPIIDTQTQEICGVETLIRWHDEGYGVVAPGMFIDWLEQDPVFFELGNWIIKTALLDMKELALENPNFIVNINLTYTQLQRDEFNERLLGILKETGFPPEHLRLELTERCKVLDLNFLRNQIIFLRSYGMQVSLDDFGTGYAAINLLFELPIDQVKIDRSFVENIQKEEAKQILLRALTECAREMKMDVCIEGIEAKAVRDYVTSHFYTTSLQGFLYSEPIVKEEILKWIEKYNRQLNKKRSEIKKKETERKKTNTEKRKNTKRKE
ncbi:EAL domain-containing protein [Eubacterium oxidoreducens]|uniref:Diguanylate cyclase (GGDEF) domain-containing protein n=1 Tax=Eubacterium oxidoreducens TaxID=1732 RepID=A0A1G6C4G9_EUBOX|nr:EAL domain-containing protein [Eubacterium oxidoreducens]SDB27775.1 diguanylate cyclase (GGDEF) domain-containing protein [Eubacterium oxidoreducens]